MAKIVFIERLGNAGQYDEGNAGKLIEASSYQIADALYADLLAASKVTSKWTGAQIYQDGEGPDYKDAKGSNRLLSDLYESDNMTKNPAADFSFSFTAADYGYKDDFSTDLA